MRVPTESRSAECHHNLHPPESSSLHVASTSSAGRLTTRGPYFPCILSQSLNAARSELGSYACTPCIVCSLFAWQGDERAASSPSAVVASARPSCSIHRPGRRARYGEYASSIASCVVLQSCLGPTMVTSSDLQYDVGWLNCCRSPILKRWPADPTAKLYSRGECSYRSSS